MSMAFGISSDDIIGVALRRGMSITEEQADAWFDEIDHDEVESAALAGDDMDEQTDYAFDEIERQLEELGHMPSKSKKTKGVKP